MLKCFVFVLCAVTIVLCTPGHENLREKQSSRQEQVTDRLNGASRTKRQSLEKFDIVYLEAESIDSSKLKDLQSKESPRLAPVNDVINTEQNFQELLNTNLEIVSQNSNYIVYKLKGTDDSPLNSFPNNKRSQAPDNQYNNYNTGLYSGYSDARNPSPPPFPEDRDPPPPPPDHRPPPPPPHHHPPPPPRDGGPPPHHYPPPPPPGHYPPPPDHYPPPPPPHDHHHPPPPPSDDYYRSRYYDRPPSLPPPRSSYDDRSRRFYDDRQTRQSSYDRPPPTHRGGPPPPHYEGSPSHDEGRPPRYDEPPRHHGGPPPRDGPPNQYDRGPPPPRGGPPDRYDHRPPPHHGGPPDRFDGRPPPPPDRNDDRRPPPRGGPPDRFDNRPPYDRPPHDRDQYYNQDNRNNEYTQNGDHSGKLTDATQISSTTEDVIDNNQYQLDVRFLDDEQKPAEDLKTDVAVTTARPLSPFMFQAAAVTPED